MIFAIIGLLVVLVLAVALSVYAAAAIFAAQADIRQMRDEAQDQIIALRKQMKCVLRDAQRTNATATRVLNKQYRQQKDVDDILYHAKIARERAELNG